MKIPLWWRRADFVRAIDGDTIECVVDLGYGTKISGRNAVVRLASINTPELNSPDPAVRAKALAARDELHNLLAGKRLMLHTFKDSREKYGRFLAIVHVVKLETADDVEVEDFTINQRMIELGFGVPI